jgi:prophage tail gpP-like protein
MSSDLRLLVNGRQYAGWKGVRVTRSIECVAGSFELDVSDRWGDQDEPWPIAEEDACRIEIDAEIVIDGFVDKRSLSISGSARSLSYSGRDRSAAMVDSSALVSATSGSTKWSFRNASFMDLARKVAEPFGVKVSLQAGVELRTLTNLSKKTSVISPGESAYSVLEQAARAAGVLVVSDGRGGIVIARAGTERCPTALVEGKNILAASVEYDATDRFHRYVLATQVAGTDTASGSVTRVQAEATDEAVRRTERVLLIVPEKSLGADYARQRADWEARVRAARSERVSVTVQGWKQPNGDLWPLNQIVPVRSPGIGVRGDLLIAGTTMALDDGGEVTELSLVRPDAFTPEPRAIVKSSGGAWKEIAGGAIPVVDASRGR